MNKGISILSFQTLEFWPNFCTHWFSDVILQNHGILALFLKALELWFYPCEHWISGPIFIHIWILISSYPSKDLYSDLILPSFGIMVLLLKTLEFLCYSSTGNIGILILSLKTLWFWPFFFYKHWNSYLILPHVRILVLFLETLGSWPYPPNIGIAAPIFLTLEFLPYFNARWNFDVILRNIETLSLFL